MKRKMLFEIETDVTNDNDMINLVGTLIHMRPKVDGITLTTKSVMFKNEIGLWFKLAKDGGVCLIDDEALLEDLNDVEYLEESL